MIGITGLVKWITLPWLRFHYKLTFSASSCSQSFFRIFIRIIRSHFRTMINSFMPIDYDFQFRALFSCKKRKKKKKKVSIEMFGPSIGSFLAVCFGSTSWSLPWRRHRHPLIHLQEFFRDSYGILNRDYINSSWIQLRFGFGLLFKDGGLVAAAFQIPPPYPPPLPPSNPTSVPPGKFPHQSNKMKLELCSRLVCSIVNIFTQCGPAKCQLQRAKWRFRTSITFWTVNLI